MTTSGADHESPLQSDVGTVDGAAAFREAADTAPVLIWMSGQDSLCTYFNSTWLGFTGRTLEQVLGTGWRAGVHPDDLEQCIETYSSSFDARRPFVMEYRLRRRDGEYRWILDHGMPRFDSNGAFLGFMGSCLDITERKRLEWEQAVLLDASRLLNSSLGYEETLQHIARLAIGNLADVCLVDIIGDDSPARGVAVAHRDPDLEERLRTIRRQHPPSIERLDPMVRRVLSEGRPLVVNELPEEVLRRSYQNPEMQRVILDILPRHLLCVPLHVRGVTIGAISFGATTRGRYRRADVVFAEELARRCATAIDNARLYRDAQRRADLLSDIAAASRAFAEAGLDPDTLLEMVARRIGALTGDGCILRLDTDDEVVSDAVAVWHPDPEAARMVLEIVTGDGPNPWERLPGTVLRSGEPLLLTASPGEDLSAQVSPVFRPYVERFHVTGLLILPLIVRGRIIGTLSLAREGDRPAYSALERAFRHSLADRAALSIDNALHFAGERAARAEAEAANRTKDEFLSVLSHELRTPLTPIIGQTQLMLRRPDLPSVVSDGLKTIDRNARMQARLVEDLLDVSRIVTGKLSIERQVVPLDAVVESALDSIRSVAAEKQINLVVTIEPHAPVLGDPHRLRQIVSNLLSNAVKFTPPGGTVTASLGMGDGMARIAVSDTGIGIKRDFLPKVFDRFRQADASSTRGYAGLGLGLSIVSHLVELHGGEVRASSGGIGQGATFTVLLPPATAVVDGESPLDDSGVAGLSGARVLVVEDDPDTRELLRMILESEGARVTTAGSAAEAMDAIGQVRPTLILADIGLPSEDGYALIGKIRALPDDTGGSTPAVALTAYAGSDDRRRALAAGFDEHLTKPIEPDVLIATLVTLAPQPSAGASALS